MKFYSILIIQLFYISSCSGQNTKHINVIQNVGKSDQFINAIENKGIVYFSKDKGETWRNTSNGIPQNVRIGLGGIVSSGNLLAIATKENGVFVYNEKDSSWAEIHTEKTIIEANLGAISYFKNTFYLGTQSKGIFFSNDNGKVWNTLNTGLSNLTIRRFLMFDNKFYVCTNDGFYLLDEKTKTWNLEYGENGLQVNGATMFQHKIYIATNRGIFCNDKLKSWKNVLVNHSVHNISSDFEQLYGMTYTSLLMSSNDGIQWQNIQNGLPKDLYTFNVFRQNEYVFAGQWDGVYRKNSNFMNWEKSSKGLPLDFAATNLNEFNDILVISTSERKLKEGSTVEILNPKK